MYDYLFNFDPYKIVFFRFTDDAFDAEQAATIGVDFKVKTITINGDKVSDSAHIFLNELLFQLFGGLGSN